MGSGRRHHRAWWGGHEVGRVKPPVVEVGAQESYAKVTSALTFVPELD